MTAFSDALMDNDPAAPEPTPAPALPIPGALVITSSPGGDDHPGVLCVQVSDDRGIVVAHEHVDAAKVKAIAKALPTPAARAFGQAIATAAARWHAEAQQVVDDAAAQAEHASAIHDAARGLT